MPCIALIVAGGSGSRMGSGIPKQYLDIGGRPLLRWTVEAFLAHPGVDAVRVVIHPAMRPAYDAAVAGLPLDEPVAGGASRQDSVRLGLEALARGAAVPKRVLIHDAARPCIDAGTISAVIDALDRHPGAIAALPVVDTLKRADGGGMRIGATVARDGLWRAQTPQGFRFADILAAHRAVAGEELTDDAAVAERAGLTVALVRGREENLKVTTTDDLQRAARILGAGAAWEPRVGSGYDVHRFSEDDAGPAGFVTLCGVQVPHPHRLEGHSDADVALHALTDALLGALADGDIGSHFPPSDPQWRGADSARFLAFAADRVRAAGGRIAHVDITIVCERPKVGPHRAPMTARVAAILGLPESRVGIKATTTEKLGFTGRGEGIAANAVATVLLPP